MEYSISQLSTVEECEAVLTQAQKQKEDLEFSKTSKDRNRTRYAEQSVRTDADLQAINGEISVVELIIAGLQIGEVKDEMDVKLKRLEYRKFLLEERNENYGLVALLDRELDVALVEAELTALDDFIAQVEAHKATL